MLKKPTTGRRRIDIRNRTWLSQSRKPGDESRRNHIVSAIEDRNELCTNCVIAMDIADTDVQLCPSHAHPPTLVHARLLDIRWTPTAKSMLNH